MGIIISSLEELWQAATPNALAALLFASGLAVVLHVRSRKYRAARRRLLNGTPRDRIGGGETIARNQSVQQIDALVESIGRSAQAQDPTNSKSMRARLRRAGYFKRSAFAYFIALRVACSVLMGCSFYGLAHLLSELAVDPLLASVAGFTLGYLAPVLLLDRRISKLRTEHRNGFPDVMDLMVVCVQAGLSLEAGIQKIGEELAEGYPSLSSHLDLTSLELRNGKSLSQAIEGLAQRLGIDEATSFATLLHQSEQLGASISDSLRAFSDDMRNKRLMRAEEKAYALPTKLVVPLTLFIFPVLLVVLLLPVAVAVSTASG